MDKLCNQTINFCIQVYCWNKANHIFCIIIMVRNSWDIFLEYYLILLTNKLESLIQFYFSCYDKHFQSFQFNHISTWILIIEMIFIYWVHVSTSHLECSEAARCYSFWNTTIKLKTWFNTNKSGSMEQSDFAWDYSKVNFFGKLLTRHKKFFGTNTTRYKIELFMLEKTVIGIKHFYYHRKLSFACMTT